MPQTINERELDLYEPVIRAFPKLDCCFTEVPFFGKHVDLVFTQHSMRTIYAVEVKLNDWRSALRQASLNQLFACYSYAAFPARIADRLAKFGSQIFLEHGVGIISVSDKPNIILPAAKSCYVYKGHRVRIKQTLKISKSQSPKSLEVVQNAIAKGKRTVEFLQTRTG
jgi:hypothetical protein